VRKGCRLCVTRAALPFLCCPFCSYKVTPKEAGVYQHTPVTVTYKPADEEEEQTATSSALVFRTYTVGQTLTIKASTCSVQLPC